MDLNLYLDLYLSETQEHLRLLNRGLLEMEAGEAGALEDVFRAAHTLKGTSAALGFTRVAELAHGLESRLSEIRAGTREVSSAEIDELLAGADALEQAIQEAVAAADPADPLTGAAAPAEDGGAAAPGPSTEATDGAAETAPDGTAHVVRVELRADAQLKAARAVILLRKAEGVAEVLGSDPPETGLDDGFGGVLRIFVGPGADPEALAEAIRSAGEVAEVAFEAVSAGGTEAERDAPGPTARSRTAPRSHHVRVDQRQLDELANGVGELVSLWGRLRDRLDVDGELEELSDRLDRLVGDLQYAALAVRMIPVAHVFDRFPRVVRDTARAQGKAVDFQVVGREIELDRAILDEIADPLVHLLRNAVDHGLEAPEEREAAGKPREGRLVLRAVRERDGVVIEVEDDGRGVARDRVAERAREAGLPVPASPGELGNEELLRLLSHPGLSTADEVTDVSGRGVGMDAVVERVRALGGAVRLHTETGAGTTFSIRLPLTLAVVQALRVRVGREDYAIALTHVSEVVELDDVPPTRLRGREVLRLRGEVVPVVRLRDALQVPEPGMESAAVVAGSGPRRAALVVDELVGREQIVVKSFDAAAGMLPVFSGATLLADGRPALVLDPMSVI